MKRPTIALLSILSLLAMGLATAGPKSCEAGSLGELAFAIQIESTTAGDPIVCPMVCCPLAADDAKAESSDEAMELNGAVTNEVEEQLAVEEDYDEHYYDEYG